MLTPDQLRSRLDLDFRVLHDMSSPLFTATAFRSAADLRQRRTPVLHATDGRDATHYLVTFHVPTLIGPGRFSATTTIGLDLTVRGYPFVEPLTWLESDPVPFSPHFKRGAPVCIGEAWQQAGGRMLLGQLVIHVCRMLNWDEIARGGGYVGWNPDAIAYHHEHYGDRPLTEGLAYPTLPAHLTHGVEPRHGPGFALLDADADADAVTNSTNGDREFPGPSNPFRILRATR